ncbi:hypothetical protein [Bacillus mycoides]|uniref:hypothetical protein n=1 Tax=Bacillus mycoides TaxID=1405 RepID=UPI0024AC9882|nr:hypothetical protein [Bacillus mycoides]MDI6535164.1 hypothetical protein [Bacillus mycoides]
MNEAVRLTPEEIEAERIKAIRRLQAREWRKNNPDKVKAARDRHFLKKAKEWEEQNGSKLI